FAVYRFCYSAVSPAFRVEAVVDQEKPVPWSQLHILEWNFKHDFFTHWALAPSLEAAPEVVPFTATKQSRSAPGWGALLNDRVALAMAAGQHIVYDDRDGYGRYLHGPWVADWDGRRRVFSATLYAGPAGVSPEALAKAVVPHLPGSEESAMTVRVPSLEDRLTAVARRLKKHDITGRWLWRLASGFARNLETLEEASRLVARLEARPTPAVPVAGAAVSVEETPNLVLVHDGVLGVGFRREREGWRLFSLYHVAADHEFLEGASPSAALWQARVMRADRKTPQLLVAPAALLSVDRERLPREAVIRLSWPGELPVIASVVMRAGTGTSVWRAVASRPVEGGGVWEFDFPRLSGLGSRSHPEADTVAVPRSWGVLYPNPVQTLNVTGGTYPSGSWSMQYALWYHGQAGLYIGTHDPRASTKRFTVAVQRDASGAGVSYSVTHLPPNMGMPGTGCAPDYDTVIGVYTGDWYEGSRLYREWARGTPWMAKGPLAKRSDVGGAIRPLALWLLISGAPAEVVPKVKAFQEFFSVPMGVHWYNWHQIPFDNDYPHYFPPKEGFKEAVAELTARGVVVMPYINGRLWDTDTDDWEVARPWAAMKAEGGNYVEVYGSKEELAPMCPATPFWQQKMRETVLTLVRDYGVSGVYLDQITAAAPALCFNPAHGHPLGGGDHWWAGYRKLLGDLRAELARTHPAAFLTSENNAESWTDL
ncbi:MAG: DUF6259 domain-containing protein, partial [Armatimonadota bacterium]|nr:DUF6259 domain-containing protein [Armatimonadota bacterium]